MSSMAGLRQTAPFVLPHQLGLYAFHTSLCDPTVDLADERVFWSILFEGVSHFNVSARELASVMNVNLSTVNRWFHGKSAPHVLVREAVVELIKQSIEAQIGESNKELRTDKIGSFAEDALAKSLSAI